MSFRCMNDISVQEIQILMVITAGTMKQLDDLIQHSEKH